MRSVLEAVACTLATSEPLGSRRSKGPSNHKSKSKTAHKRKAEKKARKIMRRGVK